MCRGVTRTYSVEKERCKGCAWMKKAQKQRCFKEY